VVVVRQVLTPNLIKGTTMQWCLDQIGGQSMKCATYRFGDGQSLRSSPRSNIAILDKSLWPIIIEQTNSVENKFDFTIGPFTNVLLLKDSFKRLFGEFEPDLHHFTLLNWT
jgi:hypothetical protein